MKNSHEKDLLIRLMRYCAYRERSPKEVLAKLADLGSEPGLSKQILNELVDENFISEARFADAYVRGKFNQNSWGRFKIRLGLQEHELSEAVIEKALLAIKERDYLIKLKKLAGKKLESIENKNAREKRALVYRYLMGKGFETDRVIKLLDTLFST